MGLPFIVINSNLGPISHRLATIRPWRIDRQKIVS